MRENLQKGMDERMRKLWTCLRVAASAKAGRNLQAFGFKGSNSMKGPGFEHQGHLPLDLIMLRVLKFCLPAGRQGIRSSVPFSLPAHYDTVSQGAGFVW